MITLKFRTQNIQDLTVYIIVKVLKCPENTIIGEFFSCAQWCGLSGVTRDPHMEGTVLANQEQLFSQPCTMGFTDRSTKSHSVWHRNIHWLSLIEHAKSTNHDSGLYIVSWGIISIIILTYLLYHILMSFLNTSFYLSIHVLTCPNLYLLISV